MSQLIQLQEHFQKFLMSDDCAIYEAIMPSKRVSVETRLGIYKEAYRLRLIESLTQNFPALYAYLGTEEFNKLASYYIEEHPSTYRSIRWFGDVLSDFIKKNYKQYDYLAELADFEWTMTLAFDAADDQRVQMEEMASIPPEAWPNMHFTLHPSLHRLNYEWNIIALWQALTKDQELPPLQQNSEAMPWVLWRLPDYIIQFYSLSQEEAFALDNLSQGLSFAALCEGLCQWIAPEEVGMNAASFLKGWIQRGMLAELMIS
jgi:hypothetical protein